MRHCQKCGRPIESENKDINFCNKCLEEQRYQNKIWEEYLKDVERKTKINNGKSN